MTWYTFQDGRLARTTDPQSSHDAAERVRPLIPGQKRLVLEALREHGPHTSKDLARLADLDRYMVARRLPDMERDGLVERVPGEVPVVWRAV
jgi:DNA-binding MarR family transcriptional regulator